MISLNSLHRLSNSNHYLIAYSGGLDSHVLLHKMASLRSQHPEISLRAIHVHHGLQQNADQWAAHCEAVCRSLDLPFLVKKVRISRERGESIEALARCERYRVIAECLFEDESLLTAHTRDDQAETLLLQLLRGAGPKGMAAMPMRKPFAHSVLLRPLLNTMRKTLQAYAEEHRLQWVEDDSNQDLAFDRNYLRHRVMPLLKARWPAVLSNVSRSARHCASAADLLEELADSDLLSLQGTEENTLSVSALLQLSSERRCNALRQWFQLQGHRVPNTKKWESFEKALLQCDQDATPVMDFNTMQARRYRDDLYLLPRLIPFDTTISMPWDLQSPLKLPADLGELSPEPYYHLFKNINLRFRQGGERIKPAGSAYTQSLKKLFQNWAVPPWRRDRIPLIYSGDRLIAVVGYCVSDEQEER